MEDVAVDALVEARVEALVEARGGVGREDVAVDASVDAVDACVEAEVLLLLCGCADCEILTMLLWLGLGGGGDRGSSRLNPDREAGRRISETTATAASTNSPRKRRQRRAVPGLWRQPSSTRLSLCDITSGAVYVACSKERTVPYQ